MLIHCSQLFGSVNQVQSYEKNVIGGAMLDNVFQHKLIVSQNHTSRNLTKKKENTHTISASVLFSVGLVDKP